MGSVVEINDLLPGMVIVKITRQNGPVKIRKSGLVTSHEMVSGLAEMGVQQVEIDPGQTVEIERPVAQKSLTQQLLQSSKRSDHSLDSALSEQFNRSLFLPSVAQIPSLWQYYAKRIISATVVLACGLGVGWLGATYEQWRPGNYSPVVTAAPTHSASQEHAANSKPSQVVPEVKTAITQGDMQVGVPGEMSQAVTAPSEKKADKLAVEAPVESPVEAAPSPAPKVVTQTPEPQAPQISSALLKRFENAINDLDSMPKSGFEPRINSASDVPRIDQLQDWVLTKLPAMVFTAHMYASNPQDRWVRVNDVRMVEGDMIASKVQIQSIEPQHVIL
ncbi:MAG: general secretion pathway protein B, partial [Paraglaciecola sp.]